VVAPFLYGYRSGQLLLNLRHRIGIINDFRHWLDGVVVEEDLPVSVIAHSFGTYIAVKYLLGFEEPPHRFNAVILTGCILNCQFDWSAELSGKVGRVLHERAPEDPWVRRMAIGKVLTRDRLFGDAGARGFSTLPPFVEERTSILFDHTNVIAADVVRGRWLPFLNAHSRALSTSTQVTDATAG
jgi:alpha-beta hydrolase superfamily lysophospholipase